MIHSNHINKSPSLTSLSYSDFRLRRIYSRQWIYHQSLAHYDKLCFWMLVTSVSANTTRWSNDVLMLGQRRRRWTNIKTSLLQRVVFAGVRLIGLLMTSVFWVLVTSVHCMLVISVRLMLMTSVRLMLMTSVRLVLMTSVLWILVISDAACWWSVYAACWWSVYA